MRTAINKENPKFKFNCTSFLMTKNMWEFFITDNKHNDDIVEAYVMGFESELGDISLKEIAPFIVVQTDKMEEVMAPAGFEWEDEKSNQ